MKKGLLLWAISILFSLLLLEVGTGLGTWLGRFPIKVPTYSLAQARNFAFWRDINPDFGAWHLPNSAYRHIKSCFDVSYHSNSYGARDEERALQSTRPRVVVLGDSMTEGYGVADAGRFTNVLERDTGIEHLNFGTTGTFGTTQYYLLYKTLASKFSHAAVLIGMLPGNDFWDNDYEFGKKTYRDRYRPYLVGEYPNYHLRYDRSTLEQSTFRDRGDWRGFGRRLLAEFTYTYNAFDYFKRLAMRTKAKDGSAGPYSGYYDYRKDQLDLVKYTFEQIKQIAGDREVIIALLPTRKDFRRYDPVVVPPLSADLAAFAAANGMRFVDLLPAMYANSTDQNGYLLPCDGHWSAGGHAAAADALKDALAPLYATMY